MKPAPTVADDLLAPAHGGRMARLRLAFAHRAGHTTATEMIAQPPLQCSRLRWNLATPERVMLTILHQGGVVQGDHYALEVDLAEASAATITTAAATQVYRMPQDCATQQMQITLAAEADLAWLPEPLILCAAADWTQTTKITLAPTAHVAWLEVLVPGRLQRHEAWQFRQYRSNWEVHDSAGRLLVADRVRLVPHEQPWTCAALAATPVVGTLYLLGPRYLAQLSILRQQWRSPTLAIDELPNRAGVIVRCLGTSASSVQQTLLHVEERVNRQDRQDEEH